MMKHHAILGACLLAASLSNAWADGVNTQLTQKARYWEQQGRLDLAAQAWRQVLLAEPGQPQALAGLAIFAARNAKLEEARRYFSELQRLHPDSPELERIRRAMQLGPGTGDALRRAEQAAARGDNIQAVQLFRQAFGDQPPPDQAAAYFFALAKTPGGTPRAIEKLRQLVRGGGQQDSYRLVLAQLLSYTPATRAEGADMLATLAHGSPYADAAQRAWRKTLIWEKSNPAWLSRIRAYLAIYPDPELAQAQIRLANGLQQRVASQEAQRRAEAQTQRQRSLAAEAAQRLARQQDAYAALHAGRLDEAQRIFESLHQAQPARTDFILGLGLTALQSRDFNRAIAQFQAAQRLAGGKGDKYAALIRDARLGQLREAASKARKAGNDTQASTRLQAALALKPGDPGLLLDLASLELRQGHPERAETLYRRLTQAQPRNADAWRGLAAALHSQKQSRQVLSLMERMPATVRQAIQRDPDFLALLGAVYVDMGQDRQAEQTFNAALQRRPDPALELQLAWVLYRMQQWDTLGTRLDKLAQAPALSPAQQATLEELRRLYLDGRLQSLTAQGDFDTARTFLAQQSMLSEPARQQALRRLDLLQAWALYRSGQDPALYTLLKRLQAQGGMDGSQQKELAELFRYGSSREAERYRRGGDLLAAEAIWRNMIRLFPQEAYYQRALANLLLEAHRSRDAYAILSRFGPDNSRAGYEGAVGAALASQHGQQARAWLQEAQQKWPQDYRWSMLSAQMAEARNDEQGALAAWKQALRLLPEADSATQTSKSDGAGQ